jgi:rhodanese-related sulfurtransferase/DNA-binding transcriptional ArsR family regulator
MSSTSPKHAVFVEFAQVAKIVGHPDRLEILEVLAQGEQSVEALAERVHLAVATTSQHLQNLRRGGLVASRRVGKFVLYRLADEAVVDLLSALRLVAERNVAEVDRIVRGYFHERDNLEPVSREELLARVKSDLVTVLDVRPADEFDAGHLPGAINIPLSELERRLSQLDRDREVIAYCRGPYCVYAYEAVAQLRKEGFTAHRLADGLPQWRAAGLPVVGA